MPGKSQYRRKRRLLMSRNIRQDPWSGHNPHARINSHHQDRPKTFLVINQRRQIRKTRQGPTRRQVRSVHLLVRHGPSLRLETGPARR